MLTKVLLPLAACAALGCRSDGPLRAATDAVFPPFHFVDEDGSLAGFDIELVRQAAQRAGLEIDIARAPSYAALFEELTAGKIDVVAATTGITAERQERFAFTRPYFVTCLAAVVRTGADEPRTPDELAGRAVAASAGTTSASAAHRIRGARVLETMRWRDSLAALRAGEVDAVIIDEFEAVPFSRSAPDLDVLPAPVAIESYGLVLRKSDHELRRKLNDAIESMESDGTLALLATRFGLERSASWPVRLRAAGHRRGSPQKVTETASDVLKPAPVTSPERNQCWKCRVPIRPVA